MLGFKIGEVTMERKTLAKNEGTEVLDNVKSENRFGSVEVINIVGTPVTAEVGAQNQRSMEQDEASVETVDFVVDHQEGQGETLDKQGSNAIIDLTESHDMEEARKKLTATSEIRLKNSQGKVASKDADSATQETVDIVNDRPADPRFWFCDGCRRRRRRNHPCHKCTKLCDVCLQFKRRKSFHRLSGEEGISFCNSCRKETREEIEAESQERVNRKEVQVRRSLRRSALESTAEGFYTSRNIVPAIYTGMQCGICNFEVTDLVMDAAPEMVCF